VGNGLSCLITNIFLSLGTFYHYITPSEIGRLHWFYLIASVLLVLQPWPSTYDNRTTQFSTQACTTLNFLLMTASNYLRSPTLSMLIEGFRNNTIYTKTCFHRLGVDHKIELTGDASSALGSSSLYQMPLEELQVLKKYLDDHLKKGFIEPSSSPYGSPPFGSCAGILPTF
jgi:hypothetical protein